MEGISSTDHIPPFKAWSKVECYANFKDHQGLVRITLKVATRPKEIRSGESALMATDVLIHQI